MRLLRAQKTHPTPGIDPYRSLRESPESVTIAVDSTGVKVHRDGGWVEWVHGKRIMYVKLHFTVNTETHEVVAMEVSTDDTYDVKALPGPVDEVERNVRVARVIGDGAYDSSAVYDLLKSQGIEPVIKLRKNSRLDTPSPKTT